MNKDKNAVFSYIINVLLIILVRGDSSERSRVRFSGIVIITEYSV